jgi:hypothetical protein
MSLVRAGDPLQLPEALQDQLHAFRKQVWSIKMIEAVAGAVFGVVAAYLLLFALDRVWDTPHWARYALFAAAAISCAVIPVAAHRWIWRNRRLEQLARLLSRKHPSVGDQLLGIIELVRNDFEQARSRTLCVAAIEQVADEARKRDFRDSVPNPRHRLWVVLAAVPMVAVLALLAIFPAAGANAWARLLAPWMATPRYTFAAVEPLPERIVVAHGEPFTLPVHLRPKTVTKPHEGFAQLGTQQPVTALLTESNYRFDLPAQIAPQAIDVRIGDWQQRTHIEPMPRPELTSAVAEISLPEYLGLPQAHTKDVRGGALSAVNGSSIRFLTTASRELARFEVDGQEQPATGNKAASAAVPVHGPRKLEIRWQDQYGLSGQQPFTISIGGRDDEAPTLSCEGLPRQKVVLDSEMLSFKVRAHDDFGVKSVGLEWQGVAEPAVPKPAKGERLLAAGGHDKDSLDVSGTFSAKSLEIPPQLVEARVYVDDYFPGRKRVYSPTYALYVLDPQQHAIWLTEQLNKWHRQSLDVRDRELQLFETNKQLRALSSQELDRPETRRRIDTQAGAEFANGRRLSHLVATGEDLVKQASRNPEFGVGHLEKWAEMLQILKDIAGNRMPSVADLLKRSSQAPSASPTASNQKTAMTGQIRSVAAGQPSNKKSEAKKLSGIPAVVDQESSQLSPAKKDSKPSPPKSGNSQPRLTLATTTLLGSGKSPEQPPAPPAAKKLDEALKQQQDLLAEFEKVADELKRVLAELEGSTLVKRLKAASRAEYAIAGRIGEQVGDSFGVRLPDLGTKATEALAQIADQETKGSEKLSLIMDDMEAYFDRHRFVRIKSVLDDMHKQDVVGSLRQLANDMKIEKGLSIAQCEFWSDTLDRWAEDLVDPACCGSCANCKSKGSLPPAIVLEVLQILEGEMNLREETRVVQQARPSLAAAEYGKQAGKLAQTQRVLEDRVGKVIGRIRELPDAQANFGKELRLLQAVSMVMDETVGILSRPETGKPAIGAETEVIELLLQSKRINPKGGGGGGSSPGGGGSGTTQDSALTLLGSGVNAKEVRQDRGVSQTTGEAGSSLPEEFRAGLDEYFNRLERGSDEKPKAP